MEALMLTPSGRGMGWRPQLPDIRDILFRVPSPQVLPPRFSMRQDCPDIYDQGAAGSCVWNWLAFAYQFDLAKQGLPPYVVSRLFGYYLTREMEGSAGSDSGCELRDAIKVLATTGDVPETSWPYDLSKLLIPPPPNLVDQARGNRALSYASVSQDEQSIKTALANGFPVGVGITLYQSFDSASVASSGIVPMPLPNEPLLGGHAVALVGYDDGERLYEGRNSWGVGWGDKGYFRIPYDYVGHPGLASDLWVISAVMP